MKLLSLARELLPWNWSRAQTAPPGSLGLYFGTYTGLSPTMTKAGEFGEIELIINQSGLTVQHAIGTGISRFNCPLIDIRPLGQSELRTLFQPGSRAPERIDGFAINNGPVLLFIRAKSPQGPRLIVRLGRDLEAIGLTLLVDDEQVRAGIITQVEGMIAREAQTTNSIPLLKNGGVRK